jgi:alkanesulfonate monooxygenase SsuD/methylene tetrahydromethanopterin reductase-like flavin-dependent oxidoreductase (luciferase family)
MTMRLGVIEYLDLSRDGDVAEKRRKAFEGSLVADGLGYHRLWVPEHHGIGSPSTNPLSLVPVLGSHTSRIRVGAAVTLLRLRDPHLTAEDLTTAAVFCGARLDVGLGRGGVAGPGTDVLLSRQKDDEELGRALRDLVEALESGSELVEPLGVPYEGWLHGAGHRSAVLAAELGWNYCHALFLNADVDACAATLRAFRESSSSGTAAVAIALAVNNDPSKAAVDARRQPFAVIAGTPRECAETVWNVRRMTGADEVVIAEVSRDAGDHRRALKEIFAAVMDAPHGV